MSTQVQPAGSGLEAWRLAPAVVLAASVLALAFAFVSQYGFGLDPCPLCIWQRWPYAGVIGLGLAALALRRYPKAQAALLGLAALAFVAGAGIALNHVGVEQRWWAGSAACTGGAPAESLEALRAQIMAGSPARCDEIAWSFAGLSMAGWNLALSSGLAVFAGLAALRLRRLS